jgi:SOS response associated peptidase (SRAP)
VSFLHDRMPVILEPGSDEFRRWLDPNEAWSMKLGNILKPYEGELLWYQHSLSFPALMRTSYPVKKEVGKVGEDSPLFIVPLHSPENKSNIANFFSKPGTNTKPKIKGEPKSAAKEEDINTESHTPGKRKVEEMAHDIEIKDEEATPSKVKILVDETVKMGSPVKTPMRKPTKRAPPTPTKKSPAKKEAASKITNFFAVK